MNKYIELFDIKSTALPFSADQLNSVVKSTVSCGFVCCNYSELITKINDISKATEYDITLNATELLKTSVDPMKNINVIIQVEGSRINNIYDAHIESNDDNSVCTFTTYSSEFKAELYELKSKIAKKFLCVYDTINSWATAEGVSIAEDTINMLCNDFDKFSSYILSSDDLESFVNAIPKEIVDNYFKALTFYGTNLLKKYKTEVLTHFKNITKLETKVKIKHPIIVKIFALSNVASICKNEWPSLPIVSLDRRSFDSLSMYV